MPLCIYKTRFEKTGHKNAETPDFSGVSGECIYFGHSTWQREKDLNPHIRSQSPLCYHYTIPLCSLDEHLLLYQRFCICQELIVNFPDFFHLDDAGRFLANVLAAKVCGWRRRESGLREERRETGARLGCFGGRKIGKFYGFGENADSLLHFKLLYCIHQGFREEHRP